MELSYYEFNKKTIKNVIKKAKEEASEPITKVIVRVMLIGPKLIGDGELSDVLEKEHVNQENYPVRNYVYTPEYISTLSKSVYPDYIVTSKPTTSDSLFYMECIEYYELTVTSKPGKYLNDISDYIRGAVKEYAHKIIPLVAVNNINFVQIPDTILPNSEYTNCTFDNCGSPIPFCKILMYKALEMYYKSRDKDTSKGHKVIRYYVKKNIIKANVILKKLNPKLFIDVDYDINMITLYLAHKSITVYNGI